MRFYSTKICSVFLCFIFLSIALNLGCSKDSDLLRDAIIEDAITSVEEVEKDTSTEVPTVDQDNEEDTSSEVTPDINLESRTSSFSPTNDAHVQSGKGYNQNIIRLQEGQRTSYLMFDLSPK